MFKDRADAARQLAERLSAYRDQHALVLGIPRGAVPMAGIIAQSLNADLDVVLVRKLGAPGEPELAIGAVDESGWTYLSDASALVNVTPQQIEAEKQAQLQTIQGRRAQYTPWLPHLDPEGRVVIVVDDGLATGATMIAALHGLRQRHPKRLICAVPVAPADTLRRIAPLADEVLCLQTPAYFGSIGHFYDQFAQVDDQAVIDVLRAMSGRTATRPQVS